jgi:hypothetical protein
MDPTDPALLADKEALFKKIRALIKKARKDWQEAKEKEAKEQEISDKNWEGISDEELLYRIDDEFGAGSLRCDELISLGIKRISNYDGAGFKHLCCDACHHAGADIVLEDGPEHTCIDIPDCYDPRGSGPEGQKVRDRDRQGVLGILKEVLDKALDGADTKQIRDCINALAGFRGRKGGGLELFRAAYLRKAPQGHRRARS